MGEFPIGIPSKAKGGISMKMFRVQREQRTLREKRRQRVIKVLSAEEGHQVVTAGT